MNENEIKIAERFNILDKCQKLEKDFLQLSRITKVEFDLNGLYDNIYQVIILVKYEIPMELGPKKVSALSKGGFSMHTNPVIMIARC